jgi:hypothetical protein
METVASTAARVSGSPCITRWRVEPARASSHALLALSRSRTQSGSTCKGGHFFRRERRHAHTPGRREFRPEARNSCLAGERLQERFPDRSFVARPSASGTGTARAYCPKWAVGALRQLGRPPPPSSAARGGPLCEGPAEVSKRESMSPLAVRRSVPGAKAPSERSPPITYAALSNPLQEVATEQVRGAGRLARRGVFCALGLTPG